MRLWSLHPKYLDTPGLNGLWKEACLAKSRLRARTGGYYNHPELDRFKAYPEPLAAINYYLQYVWEESRWRGFNYDHRKFTRNGRHCKGTMLVSAEQLKFERQHLAQKLAERKLKSVRVTQMTELHPLFRVA